MEKGFEHVQDECCNHWNIDNSESEYTGIVITLVWFILFWTWETFTVKIPSVKELAVQIKISWLVQVHGRWYGGYLQFQI